ncbi:hypothetical protein BSPWISOXPB_10402 [uncultured Gammaproteobacteria bacterium]|jgi:RHS repeat-associated protein|nr:hypothetical protein BSPWISOXPB_10402 [uncultured Gammaproteobacteria bacterium]
MNTLEFYQQAYTYDTGNNLTNLSHQANSSTWQQTLAIHPNSNRGTETQQSTNDFDANGNLLHLDNIANLDWHYNNTLNKLTKADKSNTTQYYVYDYQGRRVRTVVESNHQVQSQRDYLPALDISINQAKQQSATLHIGTHILSESSKDNAQTPHQTRYQLNSHLQSNTLGLDDKAQTLSYEHYYPYGGTAIIAGKDKTQAQQKRYRYTGKERDDSSGLCYYGARYLAPWLARWISPDSAGVIAGLNLYVYVGNNPLKYIDPTGHVKKTPEQEAQEEQEAVEIRRTQEEIFQLDIFKRVGALKSSSRDRALGKTNFKKTHRKIEKLRHRSQINTEKLRRETGVFYLDASTQFHTSKEYRDLVFHKYKVANCRECAFVMLSELKEKYPDMTVEYLSINQSDHVFNLINRDPLTSIFEPEKWNKNCLVVDAWSGSVYTQAGFVLINTKVPHYGISNNIKGDTQHIIKHAGGKVSYRAYKNNKMISETILS